MITDEELLLYYYRDGLDAADRARIGAALSEQPDLAQRLHRLVARLDAAATTPDVSVPAHIQRRWQVALEHAAQGKATVAEPARRSFLVARRWQMAAAAVIVLALVVTIQVTRDPPIQTAEEVTPPATDAVASPNGTAAYERGLRWHLASAERQLSTLDSATPEERARLIETIIAQNRLYALAAERAGEPQLARVLRAFVPALEELARGGGEPSSSSMSRLNFELRVIQARLKAEADKSSSARPVAL